MDENKIMEMLNQIIQKQDEMQNEIKTVQHDVRRLNQIMAVFENVYGAKVDASLAGIANIQERFKRQDRLEEKVDNHDDRIFALEHAIKR